MVPRAKGRVPEVAQFILDAVGLLLRDGEPRQDGATVLLGHADNDLRRLVGK